MAHSAAMPRFTRSRGGTVFLVLDCQADRQTIVVDLLCGQYRHPLRVMAFSPEDGRIRDVSAEIAREVLSCAADMDHGLPAAVRDFVKRAGR